MVAPRESFPFALLSGARIPHPPQPPNPCPDGPMWQAMTMPSLNYQSVAYGGPRGAKVFVAGGVTVGAAKNSSVSSDGQSWHLSAQQAPVTNAISRLLYGNDIFFGNDISAAQFVSSIDGEHWTALDALNGIVVTAGMAFGNDLFVVTDSNLDQVLSTDGSGSAWVIHALPAGFRGRAIIWIGDRWLVAEAGSAAPRVFSSVDLDTWTEVATQADNTFGTNTMGYADGVVLACSGAGSAFISRSIDQGASWQNIALAGAGNVNAINFQQGAFLILQSNHVSNSADLGENWAFTASQIDESVPTSVWTFASDGRSIYVAVNSISGGSTTHAVGIC